MKKKISLFFALMIVCATLLSVFSCADEQRVESVVFEHFRPIEDNKVTVGDEGVGFQVFPMIDDEGNYFLPYLAAAQFLNNLPATDPSHNTYAGENPSMTPPYSVGEPNMFKLNKIVISYSLDPNLGFNAANWTDRELPVAVVMNPTSKAAIPFEVFNAAAAKELFDFWEKNNTNPDFYRAPIIINVHGEGVLNSGRKIKTNSLKLEIRLISGIPSADADATADSDE